MGLAADVFGLVQNALPPILTDGLSKQFRINKYAEQYANAPIRKQHLLADEGSYFVTNNAQTGIATPTGTSYSATVAIATVTNTDANIVSGKRIYLDYIKLVTTAAGSWASAGVNTQIMLYIDGSERYSSGGTDLSANIVCPNMAAPARASVAKVRFGNITAAAATGSQRCIVGIDILRPAVSATVADVVGERKYLNFGGVEAASNGSITVANANVIPVPMPPVILGPGQSMTLHYIMNGTTPGAVSFAPEFAWFER